MRGERCNHEYRGTEQDPQKLRTLPPPCCVNTRDETDNTGSRTGKKQQPIYARQIIDELAGMVFGRGYKDDIRIVGVQRDVCHSHTGAEEEDRSPPGTSKPPVG